MTYAVMVTEIMYLDRFAWTGGEWACRPSEMDRNAAYGEAGDQAVGGQTQQDGDQGPDNQVRDFDVVLRPFHLAADAPQALRQDLAHDDGPPAETSRGGKSAEKVRLDLRVGDLRQAIAPSEAEQSGHLAQIGIELSDALAEIFRQEREHGEESDQQRDAFRIEENQRQQNKRDDRHGTHGADQRTKQRLDVGRSGHSRRDS